MPLENHLWMILGGVVPILATLGDLIESKMKREAGVKDSGNIMPGHGGFLDRFDSLIFVAPFLYAIVVLFKP
jgi:phosphatidate cytidylyltransferase